MCRESVYGLKDREAVYQLCLLEEEVRVGFDVTDRAEPGDGMGNGRGSEGVGFGPGIGILEINNG